MMQPRPSDDEILFSARFWGARDVDHPPGIPITYMVLLERCGVYPVHGAPGCVAHIESQIRAAYQKYGRKLANESKMSRWGR